MNRVVYILMFLSISAQVDDTWFAAMDLPDAPVAEDDEFLPSPRHPQEELASSRQKWVFGGLQSQTADFDLLPRGVPSERTLTTASSPAPLYMFMSLQI